MFVDGRWCFHVIVFGACYVCCLCSVLLVVLVAGFVFLCVLGAYAGCCVVVNSVVVVKMFACL